MNQSTDFAIRAHRSSINADGNVKMMRDGLVRCFQGHNTICRVVPVSITSWPERWLSSTATREHDLVVSILGPPNAGTPMTCVYSPEIRIANANLTFGFFILHLGKSTLFNRLMCKEANRSYRLRSENRHRKGVSKVRM
jgi:hypothetical protein